MENSESFALDKLFEQDSQLTNTENSSSSLSPLLNYKDIGENTSPLDMHHDSLFNNFEHRVNEFKKIELEKKALPILYL